MTKSVQETGSILSAKVNSLILTSTIEALDEDKELEQFFEAIPGFCSSDVVDDFQLIFDKVGRTLASAFFIFLHRTLESRLILEEDKKGGSSFARRLPMQHISPVQPCTQAGAFLITE